jgi:tripeptide aminopeptidase
MNPTTRKAKRPPTTAKRSVAPKIALPSSNSLPVDELDSGGFEPDLDAALARVLRLMAIQGLSGEETEIAAAVKQELLDAGVPPDTIMHDRAHLHSPIGGKIGNLICKLPGTYKAPRRLLMAHLDTVPICAGTRPIVEGDYVRSANPATGLGADDRAGVAVVLTAALEIIKRRLPHPPLTFFWPVQEEVGLFGARHGELKHLGGPKLAFNWDGGTPEKVTLGATGAYRLEIKIAGIPAHAGVCPENGVSAIAMASLAIADLTRGGWHGLVLKGKHRGTTNIGVINAGNATNVVTESASLRAEARSHDPAFRERLLQEITRAFERAAKELKNAQGKRGSVEITPRLDYESFHLDEDEECVQVVDDVMASLGITPLHAVSNGGLDANWLSARGIPTVTLGCGQMNVHTTEERMHIPAFQTACRVALRLATGESG